MKSRMKRLLPYLGSCTLLLGSTMLFANDEKTVLATNATLTPTTNPDGSMILRTEEDIKKGKENVNAVIAELRELFSNNTYENLENIQRTPVYPAYTKVVETKDGLATLVYRARFTTADDMYKSIESLAVGKATFEALDEHNTIMVTDEKENIPYYKELFDAIDIPSSQILIEAKVIEVLFNDGMQRNLTVGFSDGSTSVSSQTTAPGESAVGSGLNGQFSPGNFDINFNWLLTATDAKVISSPNILVTRNEVARITTAEELPIQEANSVDGNLTFTTVFKRVGVTLEVEPQMINDKDVTIRLFPQVSSVLRYEQFPTGGTDGGTYPVPVVSIRSAESFLRVHDQQVVSLGGLYSSRDVLQQERTPILCDIPIIGELFTGKSKNREVLQLVFFIKVHVIPADAVANGFMYDPNAQAIQSEQLGDKIDNDTVIPEHSKGVSGLVDEMVDSLDNSWTPDKDNKRILETEIVHEEVKTDSSK